MTGTQRREQLLNVGRTLFAERGFEAASIEEVAQRAKISKPVVYEHFGGKEGIYAVVVDREMRDLLDRIRSALTADHPRAMLEQAADAFLSYVEQEPDGFRILVRDVPAVSTVGTFGSLVGDIAAQVQDVFAEEFTARGFDKKLAPLYSRALVGMVALVGQWWLESKKPKKEIVVAHLVNIAWNGLAHLQPRPDKNPKSGAVGRRSKRSVSK
ncbi:MAG: TetR/AcrR family transcriptional regulator [Actinomycetota bacterium]